MVAKKSTPARKTVRSKKQHTPDYYPIQKRIALGVDGGSLNGLIVADVGKLLSISNRRLYRQARKYQVKVDLNPDVTLAAQTEVEVYALRNNWDVQRALALAKKTYDDAYEHELEASGSAQIARWRDFRTESGIAGALDADPVTYGSATLALQVENTGEFVSSSVDVAGTETYFTWGNADANHLSILTEWNRTGSTSTDPSSPSTSGAYDGVNSDDQSNIEHANLGTDGNEPPYNAGTDQDQWVKVATLYVRPNPEGMQRLSTGYFHAPCGLVVLKTNNSQGNGSVYLEAKSGDYKGVSSEAMCQE